MVCMGILLWFVVRSIFYLLRRDHTDDFGGRTTQQILLRHTLELACSEYPFDNLIVILESFCNPL